MYLLGLFAYSIVFSFSLICSQIIISPEAKGWTLTNIILAIMIFPIVTIIHDALTWHFFVIVGILCFFLFWFSIYKWEKTELDFSGPEMPA